MNAHAKPPALPASAEGLPIVTEIQPHFVAHEVTDDRDAPLFRKGEFIVVDPTDTTAVDGGVVLVEWSAGRRSIVATAAKRCELRSDIIVVRHDGPDLCWWTRPIMQPSHGRIVRTSDGPLRAEQLQAITVGRVVGVAAGAAKRWAQAQCDAQRDEVDRQAMKAAMAFDADRYIELCDQTGTVYAVYDGDHGIGLMGALSAPLGGADKIYRRHAKIFDAFEAGGRHAKRQLETALRASGRVITLAAGEWRADPAMPECVRIAHFGRRHAEVAQ